MRWGRTQVKKGSDASERGGEGGRLRMDGGMDGGRIRAIYRYTGGGRGLNRVLKMGLDRA